MLGKNRGADFSKILWIVLYFFGSNSLPRPVISASLAIGCELVLLQVAMTKSEMSESETENCVARNAEEKPQPQRLLKRCIIIENMMAENPWATTIVVAMLADRVFMPKRPRERQALKARRIIRLVNDYLAQWAVKPNSLGSIDSMHATIHNSANYTRIKSQGD